MKGNFGRASANMAPNGSKSYERSGDDFLRSMWPIFPSLYVLRGCPVYQGFEKRRRLQKRDDGVVLIDPRRRKARGILSRHVPTGPASGTTRKGWLKNVPCALTCSTADGKNRDVSRPAPQGRFEAFMLKTRR